MSNDVCVVALHKKNKTTITLTDCGNRNYELCTILHNINKHLGIKFEDEYILNKRSWNRMIEIIKENKEMIEAARREYNNYLEKHHTDVYQDYLEFNETLDYFEKWMKITFDQEEEMDDCKFFYTCHNLLNYLIDSDKVNQYLDDEEYDVFIFDDFDFDDLAAEREKESRKSIAEQIKEISKKQKKD